MPMWTPLTRPRARRLARRTTCALRRAPAGPRTFETKGFDIGVKMCEAFEALVFDQFSTVSCKVGGQEAPKRRQEETKRRPRVIKRTPRREPDEIQKPSERRSKMGSIFEAVYSSTSNIFWFHFKLKNRHKLVPERVRFQVPFWTSF